MPDTSAAFRHNTILVTGGAGAIGTNLLAALTRLGAKRLLVFDNLSSAYEWNVPHEQRIHLVRGDVVSERDLEDVFKERPDIVYHLAAHFANQNSVDHPELDLMVNGMGILKVLERARKSGVERFIYASSGCGIYGSDTPMPFTEDYVSMDLYTPYQVTKMLGELYTHMYANLYGLPIVKSPVFNSYGPGRGPGGSGNGIWHFWYW